MVWTSPAAARRLATIGLLAIVATACSSAASNTPAPAAKPPGGPTPDPALVAQGATLIQQKGCGGCHTIPGIPGATAAVGPNLGGVASRSTIAGGVVQNNGPDDLKRWILDPPGVKPGTAMPNLGLSDDEATKIVSYLETLR
jgi:cytochrome c